MPSIRYPHNKHELKARRILQVVTDVDHYLDHPDHPTGLWLGELSHSWDVFFNAGFEQTIVSPTGGMAPIDPRSIRFPNFDASTRAWYKDPAKMALLDSVAPASSVDAGDYEAIFFTGGHGAMYDFPGSEELKALARGIFDAGGVVASVCHGYCALLETDLVRGQVLTGFSWAEEVLAGVADLVPYNVEQSIRERGATFRKGLLPFAPHTEVSGRLVTGQNPGSARATAHKVVEALG
ncbi:type 1 glutamine amidotransferase domain-containing protein [Corynebacterium pyruviciproducens]|uniref:type 1 glutamine amidotransferase domain-containing protein n=1 Tax=Corynebacterium pyruviciproducens TaxID=598660 RepID=UPI0024563D9F|nr:type 1 glutamine amidotransferase domain-containing protein [Corynebacterium pyruviciproducens]MDH4658558.1 type 1 glutamine amidotransferase domain-containing protein [Corynebacterium pyruviciproducens]